MTFLPQELIRKKRDGNALTAEEIAFIVQGITTGSMADEQVGAFAMAVFFRKGLVLIRHFRGQSLFGPVLYLCLPVMIYLFWSLLVFGSYRVDFPPILIMAGMLKILDNLRLSQMAAVPLRPAGQVSQWRSPKT